MAISQRTAQTAGSTTAAVTSLVVSNPTGTAVGDLLITIISIAGGTGATITTLSGWTLFQRTNNTTVLGQGIYYRIATSADVGTVTYTWTVTSEFAEICCTGYSGVDNANPFAGFNTLAKTTASTSATFGACIPQAETVYPVLCITSVQTTASQTVTAAGSYTVNAQKSATGTTFVSVCVCDQHTTYTLPLASVTPTSQTFGTSATDIDTVIFLRPSILGVQTLTTDVATFATTLASPVTSAKFSTGYNNEWVFAIVASDGAGTTSETATVTGTTLSWSLVKRSNSASDAGTVEIWQAKAATPLAFNSESVTATPSTASSVVNLQIVSFVNCFGIGATNTSASTSGTPSLSVTTTKPNSWVWGALFNTTNATAPSVGASQTLVEDYLPTGEGFWNWRETATTSTLSLVTLNVTAPTAIEYLMLVFEVLFANPIGVDVMTLNNTLGANVSQALKRAGYY